MTNQEPSTGKILISEPFMPDPNFKRAVVLLCEHTETGTFGLVVNRSLEYRLADALPELDCLDAPLFYGGPVEPNTLHFIHTRPDLFKDCSQITEELFWGGDFEELKFLITTKQLDNSNVRFFVGYSGWGSQQLEEEISQNAWIVTEAKNEQLFAEDFEEMWRSVLRNMGGSFKVMSNFPEDPSLN